MLLTAPGVYIEELSSGVHTIVGVATSVAAFVGYTGSGLDATPVILNSFADFERGFGGLVADSELSYAVQQFFANGGSQAIVVRVPKNGAKPASLTIADVGGTSHSLVLQAISTGSWAGQVTVAIDYDGLPSSGQPGYDQYAFNLTVSNLASGASESFPVVTMDPGKANFVQSVVNDPDNGSQMIQVETVEVLPATPVLGATGTPPQPARTGVIAKVTAATVVTAFGAANAVAGFNIAIDGDGGTDVPVLAATDPRPTTLTQILRLVQIRTARALQAKYPGAAVSITQTRSNLGAATLDSILVSLSIPGKPDAGAVFAKASAAMSPAPTVDAASVLGLESPLSANVAAYWFGGQSAKKDFQLSVTQGSDGTSLPTSVQLVGDEAAFTGIYALDKVDLFNILCIPDATRASVSNPSVLDSTVGSPNDVWAPAMDYCKKRRAFLLIDPPPSVNDIPSALAWKTSGLTVTDPNGAAYFPRLRIPDPLNQNALRTFAPCGVMAGVYSTTDSNRNVWKAPAGTEATLSGVQKLVYTMTDAENGELNPLGLNCLRSFPIYGFVSWGARTLAGADAMASEWKYVPVRRFALFLEESLYRGLQWVVFEPNADPLWAAIRLNVNAFMQTLYRQGAFQGTTPAAAYFVRCDSTTTTQADIDAGVVNIIVGFAPLKPAEFVVLQIQQIAGQLAS
jgi:phage tail sheath protein FI